VELPASIESAILGLVQGLTEFLPISSSGHLVAGKEILGSEAPLAFDVALHVATLVAVLIYFRRDLIDLTRHPRRWKLLGLLIMATVPGAILGVVLGDWLEGIGPWFTIYGWFFSAAYLLSSRGKGGTLHYADLGPWSALAIGTAQALAIFPGVSRSGTTIVAGLWFGLERESAARFSFILSIPLICGAGLKKGLEIDSEGIAAAGGVPSILIGMVIAFLVGLFAIHLLLRLVRSQSFANFGWYNLLVAMAFGVYLLSRSTPQ
jgi:undecaprenyl-diphosphatase